MLKAEICSRSVERLKRRIIATELAELKIEKILNDLWKGDHIKVIGLDFKNTRSGCDVEIKYGD